MLLRKFVIAIVSKYTDKGFREANRDVKVLGKSAKSAEKDLKRLDAAQRKAAKAADAMAASNRKAAKSAQDVGSKATSAAGKIGGVGKKAQDAGSKGGSALKSLGSGMSAVAGAATAVFGAATAAVGGLVALGAAGVGIGKSVIETGGSFESLRAQLSNMLGSSEMGAKAFAQIQDFTKNTPFQLEEVTSGFVKLQNRGIAPTEERMTAFGDIASASNKTLDQFVEAVLDASTGENERLKEFGIAAAKVGDKVSFTFKGQTKTVNATKDAITEALTEFGQMPGVAGAMAAQMGTTSGVMSNFKDTISATFDQVAQMGVLEEFKGLLGDLSGVAGDESIAKGLAEFLVKGLQAVRDAISNLTEQDVAEIMHVVSTAADVMATSVQLAGEAFFKLVEFAQSVRTIGKDFEALAIDVNDATGAFDRLGDTITGVEGWANRIYDAFLDVVDAIADALGIGKQFRDLIDDVTGKGRQKGIIEAGKGKAGKVLGPTGGKGGKMVNPADVDQALETGDTSKLESIANDPQFSESIRADAAQAASAIEMQNAQRQINDEALKEFERGQFEGELAAGQGDGKPKGKGKGKKEKKFFDFEKQVEQAATKQAEDYAQQELQRLMADGMVYSEAIVAARTAAEARKEELKEQFMKAGRVLDASQKNILDVLGLKGPGSMLENRPAPQSLMISISPTFIMFQNFTQQIAEVTGAKALEEITGQAGEAAVANGMDEYLARVEQMITASINLQGNRLLKADGGGRLPPGPDG